MVLSICKCSPITPPSKRSFPTTLNTVTTQGRKQRGRSAAQRRVRVALQGSKLESRLTRLSIHRHHNTCRHMAQSLVSREKTLLVSLRSVHEDPSSALTSVRCICICMGVQRMNLINKRILDSPSVQSSICRPTESRKQRRTA